MFTSELSSILNAGSTGYALMQFKYSTILDPRPCDSTPVSIFSGNVLGGSKLIAIDCARHTCYIAVNRNVFGYFILVRIGRASTFKTSCKTRRYISIFQRGKWPRMSIFQPEDDS